MNHIPYLLRHRRGTSGEWLASSIILEDGEMGIEVLPNGTHSIKIGDGKKLWIDLPYGISFVSDEAVLFIANRMKEFFSTKEDVLTPTALAKEVKAQIAGWIGEKPENFELFQDLKTILKKNGKVLDEVGPLNFYTKDEVDEFIRSVRTFSREDIAKLLKKKAELVHVQDLQTRVETLELKTDPPPPTYSKEELDKKLLAVEMNGASTIKSLIQTVDQLQKANDDLTKKVELLEKSVEKALSKLSDKADRELVYSRKDVDARMKDFISSRDLLDLNATVDRLEVLADLDLSKIVSSDNVYTKTEVQHMIQKALTSK